MPDLGHELMFGVSLPNPASQAATVVRLAQLSEQRGLDLIGVQDHPYNPDLLDTWTLLAHLAAATDTISLLPDVACVPLRAPAVLARAAASLDLLVRRTGGTGRGRRLFPGFDRRVRRPDLDPRRVGRGTRGGDRGDPGDLDRGRTDHPAGQVPSSRAGRAWPGACPSHRHLGGVPTSARMLSLTVAIGRRLDPVSGVCVPDGNRAAQRASRRAGAGRRTASRRTSSRLYNVSGRFAPNGRGFLDGPSAALGRAAHRTRSRAGILVVHPGSVRRHHRLHQPVRRRGRARCAGAGVGGTFGNAGPREKIPAATVEVSGGLSENLPDGTVRLERDGNWGSAGGLPVGDRPRRRSAHLDGVQPVARTTTGTWSRSTIICGPNSNRSARR